VRARRVKKAVRKNFDQSASAYQEFEQRSGFFTGLAGELAQWAGVKKGMRVLDVGCGTGVSTAALARLVGDGGLVVGVDLSEGMLREAHRTLAGERNVELLHGDAEDLGEVIRSYGVFDAALFNATIFLLPQPAAAVREAAQVLAPGGVMGWNNLLGLEDAAGADLYPALEEKAGVPLRRPQLGGVEELERGGGDVPWANAPLEEAAVRESLFPVDWETAWDFYLIPAQSAGLLPKIPYEERVALLRPAFDAVSQGRGEGPAFRWRFVRYRINAS